LVIHQKSSTKNVSLKLQTEVGTDIDMQTEHSIKTDFK
jgi:hypothetical protein